MASSDGANYGTPSPVPKATSTTTSTDTHTSSTTTEDSNRLENSNATLPMTNIFVFNSFL